VRRIRQSPAGGGRPPLPCAVDESGLLELIARRSAGLPAEFPAVLVGPGDDCALVLVGDGPAILKVDQLIMGVHVAPGTPADLIARKALARPLSDIAAAAGKPVCALVSAALPDLRGADALFEALHGWSRRFACPLVGGDIAVTRAPAAPMVLSVTVLGTPHPSRGMARRGGARPGDVLCVTGALGGSFRARADAEFPFDGGGKHLTFTPRVAEAAILADALGDGLHAMMDVSDGLGKDASRLARASGARIEIDAASVPIDKGATLAGALSDGEDYELLFCCDAARAPRGELGATGTPVRVIGRVVEGSGCVVVDESGGTRDAGAFGWDHGAKSAS